MDNTAVLVTPSSKQSSQGKKSPWRGIRRQEMIAGYLFLLPNLLGFLTFSVFPILAALYLTFTDWDLGGTPELVGFDNFGRMVRDDIFWKAFFNTFYFAFIAVPTGVFFAFCLALLINRKIRGILTFRLIYFLPHLTLTVAAAIVWAWIYHPELGLINYMLDLVGIEGPNWLYNGKWAMPAIIIMSNWHGVGYAMLIFLAGLQGIPAELYEAATVDGASGWQQLRHITVPMLSPATFFVLVTSLIGAFQGFDQFYVMTNGGPAFATTTLVLHIFKNGFLYFKMGYATSMATVLFLCILAITLVQWRVAKNWVFGFDTDQT
jgi:multiple sugar transport system permease protein